MFLVDTFSSGHLRIYKLHRIREDNIFFKSRHGLFQSKDIRCIRWSGGELNPALTAVLGMAVKKVLAGLVIAAEAAVRHVVGFILLQGARLERTTNDNQSIKL